MRPIVAGAAIFLVSTVALAREQPSSTPKKPTLDDDQIRELPLFAPTPEYPAKARLQRITGRGIFTVHVRTETGAVTTIDVERSTGTAILDKAVLSAFSKWRFKPALLRNLQRRMNPGDSSGELVFAIPVTFTMEDKGALWHYTTQLRATQSRFP